VTRAEQISAALGLLAPPADRLEACRRHIDWALDIIASAGRAAEHAKVPEKARRTYTDALRRVQTATRAHIRAGGSVALSPALIDSAVNLNNHWEKGWGRRHEGWSPPPLTIKADTAVALALQLLNEYDGVIKISRSPGPGGSWFRLAAVLYGDRRTDLFRRLRAFKIRSR
jgi:hypothetical protein